MKNNWKKIASGGWKKEGLPHSDFVVVYKSDLGWTMQHGKNWKWGRERFSTKKDALKRALKHMMEN